MMASIHSQITGDQNQITEEEEIMGVHRGFETEAAESAGLAVDRFPKTEDEIAKAESVVTQALEKLSLHDREKVIFDLHGIDTTNMVEDGDDPLMVDAKLHELNKHLNLIPEKPAYDRAKLLNRDFVESRFFQLMCLRKERFDAEKAADFMVYHLEKKMELFGDGEILARDVRLTDLGPDDLEVVKSGCIQICPSRDLAGRTIISYIAKYKKYKDPHNLCRAMWYIFMCAMRDEETQKKGVVLLLQNYLSRTVKFSDIAIIRRAQTALPQRVCAAHYCFSNPVLWPAIAGMKLFHIATDNCMRFRTHFGAPKDIAFDLQTFGIPTDCCPTEDPDITWHQEWLHLQQMKEESEANVSAVVIPRRFDVLFGKGKKAREHPGTIRCQYLVELMRHQYEQASRQEKTIVADQIIAAIRESKGRFLKCDKGLWMEVEHSVGREKISHWFRHMRSKNTASSKAAGGGTNSSTKRPSMSVSMYSNKRPDLVDSA